MKAIFLGFAVLSASFSALAETNVLYCSDSNIEIQIQETRNNVSGGYRAKLLSYDVAENSLHTEFYKIVAKHQDGSELAGDDVAIPEVLEIVAGTQKVLTLTLPSRNSLAFNGSAILDNTHVQIPINCTSNR